MNNHYKKHTIKINDIDIQVIEYYGTLYRADPSYIDKNTIYAGASYKFFALTTKNANIYTKRNSVPKINELKVKSRFTLNLIDILDYNTRINLAHIIGPEILDVVFPIREKTVTVQPEYRNNMNLLNTGFTTNIVKYVSRESSSNSRNGNPDYKLMDLLCRLSGIDGYYMDPKGEFFHTEVALCRSGLNKLEFTEASIKSHKPPEIKRNKGKKRRYTNSNSQNGGLRRKSRKTRKLRR